MMSRDPGMSVQKVRENAVSTSSKIVIEDSDEDLIGGWKLLSPRESNTVRTFPLEEVVFLVTDTAIYRVCFDWNNEKVSSFERIELRKITGVIKGVYVTSTLTSAQTDEGRNHGFVVKYRSAKEDIARVNTRSLSSAVNLDKKNDDEVASNISPTSGTEEKSALKVLAFKAPPARSSLVIEGQGTHGMSERDLVNSICDEICRVARNGRIEIDGFVEETDIISLQEAKNKTGLVEQWSHSVKRMVWG